MTPMPPRLRKRDGGLPGVITTFSMGRWEPGSALASYLMDVFTTATPARPPKEDTSPLIITGRSALAANEDASKFLQPVRRLENGRGQDCDRSGERIGHRRFGERAPRRCEERTSWSSFCGGRSTRKRDS